MDECPLKFNFTVSIITKAFFISNLGSTMIECELGKQCEKDQWYHPPCIGLTKKTTPSIF